MAGGDRQRHSFQRAADRGLRRIEIPMRVEPDDARIVTQPGQSSQARTAVPSQHQRWTAMRRDRLREPRIDVRNAVALDHDARLMNRLQNDQRTAPHLDSRGAPGDKEPRSFARPPQQREKYRGRPQTRRASGETDVGQPLAAIVKEDQQSKKCHAQTDHRDPP